LYPTQEFSLLDTDDRKRDVRIKYRVHGYCFLVESREWRNFGYFNMMQCVSMYLSNYLRCLIQRRRYSREIILVLIIESVLLLDGEIGLLV